MAGKEKSIITKILICSGLAIAIYAGGWLTNEWRSKGQETEYTRQLRRELIASTTANGVLQSANITLTETNNELRREVKESRRVLNAVRYATEELEKGIARTGDIVTICIEFVRQLREVDSQDSEE